MFNIPQIFDDEFSPTNDQNEKDSAQAQASTDKNSDEDTTAETTDTDKDQQNNESEQEPEPPTEPYSLRDWLYDLDDKNGRPLIHAAYKSAQDGKHICSL